MSTEISKLQKEGFVKTNRNHFELIACNETTKTENGGYKLTYYNEDVPVLTLEARYYDGEDQPLDSVWQRYFQRSGVRTWK